MLRIFLLLLCSGILFSCGEQGDKDQQVSNQNPNRECKEGVDVQKSLENQQKNAAFIAKKEKLNSVRQETWGGGQIEFSVSLSDTHPGKLNININEYQFQKVNKLLSIDPPSQAFYDDIKKLLSSELALWEDPAYGIINRPCVEPVPAPTGSWTSYYIVKANGEKIAISNKKTLDQIQRLSPIRNLIDQHMKTSK